MASTHFESASVGNSDDSFGFRCRRRKWLLDVHVSPGVERLNRQRPMRRGRSADVDDIHLGSGEQLSERGEPLCRRSNGSQSAKRRLGGICECDYLRRHGAACHGACMIRCHLSRADYADPQLRGLQSPSRQIGIIQFSRIVDHRHLFVKLD